jgi:hypothetical protein
VGEYNEEPSRPRPSYPPRRHYETNGVMGRLNYLYERYRVIFTLIFIPFVVFLFRWGQAVERRIGNAEGALEIIVRAKCVELTPGQISVTGLDCDRVLRARAPSFQPESER